MSSYGGNDERCETCALTYGRFRTGFTYQDVWYMCGWTPQDTPPNEWKYKRRGTVLGKWFEIKQDMWAQHLEECARVAVTGES